METGDRKRRCVAFIVVLLTHSRAIQPLKGLEGVGVDCIDPVGVDLYACIQRAACLLEVCFTVRGFYKVLHVLNEAQAERVLGIDLALCRELDAILVDVVYLRP